jgi:hypothetical protein
VEQVAYLFVVEFDVRAHDEVIFGGVCFCGGEDGFEAAGDDAPVCFLPEVAHHGVGFA